MAALKYRRFEREGLAKLATNVSALAMAKGISLEERFCYVLPKKITAIKKNYLRQVLGGEYSEDKASVTVKNPEEFGDELHTTSPGRTRFASLLAYEADFENNGNLKACYAGSVKFCLVEMPETEFASLVKRVLLENRFGTQCSAEEYGNKIKEQIKWQARRIGNQANHPETPEKIVL